MAIDNAEKRRSVAGIAFSIFLGVTPNASQDAEWRQQAGWGYSGIAAGEPVAPEPEPEVVAVPSVRTGGGGGDGGHHWIFDEAERRKRQRTLDAEAERLNREKKRDLKALDRIISEAVNPARKKKRHAKASDGIVADQRAERLKEQIAATERKIAALKAQANELRARKTKRRSEDDEDETIVLLMMH